MPKGAYMYKRLELHNHTTESDSSLSCSELLEYMINDRVDAFALTDHNTISGHAKMKALLSETNAPIACIYGMEYTTYYGHILCLNLAEYVPWETIDKNHPELLFAAARQKGALAGIAHPFSFGEPFARGCRFEMNVTDYSVVDFIEIFNNPEPLYEVNEPGLLLWENLVLAGKRLAATCGMDLHGAWSMADQYATFIEGEPGGDVAAELESAVRNQRTWVSRGPILTARLLPDAGCLKLTVVPSGKPGFTDKGCYLAACKTRTDTVTAPVRTGETLTLPLSRFRDADVIIPKLYGENTDVSQLLCVSPAIVR